MNRPNRRSSGFTLVELVIVCSLVAIIAGTITVNTTGWVSENLDPNARWRIEHEARTAAQWIRNLIMISKVDQIDTDLEISDLSIGTNRLRAYRRVTGKTVEWRSDIIRMMVSSSSPTIREHFSISSRFGTVTPAIDISVYHLDSSGRSIPSGIHIIVSGRGRVEVVKK